MGKNHYSGGSQLLHKGSPLFQKSNILDLPKTARRNTVKNYLNDIQDIFSNIKILLDSESSIRKDVFQGKLYHWVLVIFTILRKRQSNDKGWKDEFVLILVSAPVLLLIWSVFSDDPNIQQKLDIFFDKFSNLPFWYQSLFIGVVASIYGLKGADIFKKK